MSAADSIINSQAFPHQVVQATGGVTVLRQLVFKHLERRPTGAWKLHDESGSLFAKSQNFRDGIPASNSSRKTNDSQPLGPGGGTTYHDQIRLGMSSDPAGTRTINRARGGQRLGW
jgi:hypothetical protein